MARETSAAAAADNLPEHLGAPQGEVDGFSYRLAAHRNGLKAKVILGGAELNEEGGPADKEPVPVAQGRFAGDPLAVERGAVSAAQVADRGPLLGDGEQAVPAAGRGRAREPDVAPHGTAENV